MDTKGKDENSMSSDFGDLSNNELDPVMAEVSPLLAQINSFREYKRDIDALDEDKIKRKVFISMKNRSGSKVIAFVDK
jgi:hypothetical protein